MAYKNLDTFLLLLIFIWFKFDSYSLYILLKYGVLYISIIRIYLFDI